MNRKNIRTPVRSAANFEFHANYDHVNEVARKITKALEQMGVRAMIPGASFPMEMENSLLERCGLFPINPLQLLRD